MEIIYRRNKIFHSLSSILDEFLKVDYHRFILLTIDSNSITSFISNKVGADGYTKSKTSTNFVEMCLVFHE